MATLGPITCVTIASTDLPSIISTYQRYLGYQVVDEGSIPAALAETWARPGMKGRHYALLRPEGRGITAIRFVESRAPADYVPFRHMGWNAAELMVQDTDAAAARLADSPFKIIGPPADLSFSDKIRAMQVLGPAQESLYLTSFKQKLPEFDTPDPHAFIDRVFIVIVGGPTAATLNHYYTTHFGAAKAPVIPGVISVISQAHGLPPSTPHELAAIALRGQSYIEADTMPAGTRPRESLPGELPPAVSMVGFDVATLPSTVAYLSPARAIEIAPYGGRRVAVCVGAGGEWIELTEA